MLEARGQLNAALRIFEHLRARPWIDRTTAELRATGQTKPRAGDNVDTTCHEPLVHASPPEVHVGGVMTSFGSVIV